ncbi:MAG: methionine--tRNA ligase [Acidobacteriota bacterium]
MSTFYLTTPIYYVNGVPHVGHAYTTVVADAIARYKRMSGYEVCLLTGTDEHGLKIERAARDSGMSPQELTDTYAASFREAWKRLGIQFDEFIRTTEERHHQAVADLFQRIQEKRFIYLDKYSGQYCVSCEAYVPENQEVCPDCGRPTEFMTEESYFFKLSAFQEKLLSFYQDNPNFILPSSRMNEMISFVKGGLKDLSLSRTSFKWGIPVPSNDRHIFYVWFDALTAYISGIGYKNNPAVFEKYWPANVHLIGKDILRFHAVYWPAFLMAAGLEPPRHLLVNGWWTVNGEKMSKSRANFVSAEELADLLPPDCIKYFLLREIPLGADGNFSYESVAARVNSDLANDLGNLASRALKMIHSYFDAKIPEPGEAEGGENQLRQFTLETVQLYCDNFDRLQINKALDNVWELIAAANRYIVANEPWALARIPARRERLGTILYYSAETLRVISILLGPIIPDGTSAILAQLGVSEPLGQHKITSINWGRLKPGTAIGELKSVYPRLDISEFLERVQAKRQMKPQAVPESVKPSKDSDQIDVSEFGKVEMRVGKIVSAERVEKSRKLLRLQVDIGSEVRQVVAGIGEKYDPEGLPGRVVVVVTNLKPAKLMGVESNGMIVAASEGGKPVLATFSEPVQIGARLK